MIHPLERPMTFPLDRPNHVVICPDGTRRYAIKQGLTIEEAYKVSAQRLLEVIRWLIDEHAIPNVTVYLTHPSTHITRPQGQLQALYRVFADFLAQCTIFCSEFDIQLQAVGELELLPISLYTTLKHLQAATIHHHNLLTLLIGYSARREILRAAAQCPPGASFANFASFLWVQLPVHLILRTGGVPQIGDMLLLQSIEARLFFINKLFPELTRQDIDWVLAEFAKCNRCGGEDLERRRTLQ